MRRIVRLEDDQRREILRLYATGRSSHEVARMLELPQSTVHRWLVEANATRRSEAAYALRSKQSQTA